VYGTFYREGPYSQKDPAGLVPGETRTLYCGLVGNSKQERNSRFRFEADYISPFEVRCMLTAAVVCPAQSAANAFRLLEERPRPRTLARSVVLYLVHCGPYCTLPVTAASTASRVIEETVTSRTQPPANTTMRARTDPRGVKRVHARMQVFEKIVTTIGPDYSTEAFKPQIPVSWLRLPCRPGPPTTIQSCSMQRRKRLAFRFKTARTHARRRR
jgi:hypothetical protein